ncbi:unnamed protein product [Adineta ricciae]|uniref:Uncharacterized protein n=1 Tax=Adineta ricciae TaxID=249248 RepID=A0A813TF64_ADIRI|nr:unnamed protein product [Adineta ricciae]CAF1385359.1 unnamed protein product [Adineta ricciae]
MFPKQRPVPAEVASWMDKDLAIGELTAATRFVTNDSRQNLIVSRRFFSDLLTLSFERHRKILTCNFDKKNFLRNQRAKSETSMPGLRPYVDQLISETDGVVLGGSQTQRNEGNSFVSPSTQSLFCRPETKSDLTFNRRPDSSIPRVKTAQTVKSQPEMPTSSTPIKPPAQRPLTGIQTTREQFGVSASSKKSPIDLTPIIASKKPKHQRPITRQQISRDRLNYLAQPKNYRFKSAGLTRTQPIEIEQQTISDENYRDFDRISQPTQSRMQSALPDKTRNIVQDGRFQQLLDVFSEVHESKISSTQTVTSIIQSNPSLQDDKGRWRSARQSIVNSKPTFRNRRQTLADKLNNKFDVFLIDVGA